MRIVIRHDGRLSHHEKEIVSAFGTVPNANVVVFNDELARPTGATIKFMVVHVE